MCDNCDVVSIGFSGKDYSLVQTQLIQNPTTGNNNAKLNHSKEHSRSLVSTTNNKGGSMYIRKSMRTSQRYANIYYQQLTSYGKL